MCVSVQAIKYHWFYKTAQDCCADSILDPMPGTNLDEKGEVAKSQCTASVKKIGTQHGRSMATLPVLLAAATTDNEAREHARHDILAYTKLIRDAATGMFEKAGMDMNHATTTLMESTSEHEIMERSKHVTNFLPTMQRKQHPSHSAPAVHGKLVD